jgi:hypothetical protein
MKGCGYGRRPGGPRRRERVVLFRLKREARLLEKFIRSKQLREASR